jgi:hypothetical protein
MTDTIGATEISAERPKPPIRGLPKRNALLKAFGDAIDQLYSGGP